MHGYQLHDTTTMFIKSGEAKYFHKWMLKLDLSEKTS